jgi:hypothetical protein
MLFQTIKISRKKLQEMSVEECNLITSLNCDSALEPEEERWVTTSYERGGEGTSKKDDGNRETGKWELGKRVGEETTENVQLLCVVNSRRVVG